MEDVALKGVNFHLEEWLDRKTDIDENLPRLYSGDVVVVPSALAFDHFWVDNLPVLAICRLLSRCRRVWTLLHRQSC